MQIEIVEAPSEEPDSLDSEQSYNNYTKDTVLCSFVKFETGEVSVSILDKCWVELFNSINIKELSSLFEVTINSSPHSANLQGKKTTLAIVATDNAHMRQLNRQFRNKTLPTNILSFPDGSIEQNHEEYHLGDVFLGYEIIKKEAISQQIPLKNHVMHLIVHGTLHLLGYDHENDHQAKIMERKEAAILDIFNIPDPYLV